MCVSHNLACKHREGSVVFHVKGIDGNNETCRGMGGVPIWFASLQFKIESPLQNPQNSNY